MASLTGNLMNIMPAIQGNHRGIQLGDIGVFGADLRMALGARLLRIQAHLRAFHEMTGSALQTFMDRPLQVLVVINTWFMTFFAQLCAVFNRDIIPFRCIEKRKLERGFAGWLMARFTLDGLPLWAVFCDNLPGTCLIDRFHKTFNIVFSCLEWCMAIETIIRQGFLLVVLRVCQNNLRARRVQGDCPPLMFFGMAAGTICPRNMRVIDWC